VLNVQLTARKSSDEVDFGLIEEVIALPLKSRMRLLLNFEDDIAWKSAGDLIALATELDLGTTADTLVDRDMKDLPLNSRFSAIALLAAVLVLDQLALAMALGTQRLEALNHRPHLPKHGLVTQTVTSGTLPHRSFLATAALALWAEDRLLQRQLGHLAPVHILEADLVNVVNRSGLLWTRIRAHVTEHATHAEELRKEVLSGHAAAHASLL
jgi:hypothetical protein